MSVLLLTLWVAFYPLCVLLQLSKRREKREEAQKNLNAAEEAGDAENIERFTKRLVKVTPEHNRECQQLLALMGIPYVEVW